MKIIQVAAAIGLTACLFNSCSSPDKNPDLVEKKATPAKITAPFRFHKAVEVKPGLTLDVVSWGRGSGSAGAYLILRSDSTNLEYRSISGELDGKIIDVWNMDMDSDGNTELFIQARGEGEGSHLTMYVYEFADNGSSRKINFPELGSSTKKGYKGGDSLYVRDDKLFREFPVINSNNKAESKAAESKKVLEYGLRNNNLTVNVVEQEPEEKNKKQ